MPKKLDIFSSLKSYNKFYLVNVNHLYKLKYEFAFKNIYQLLNDNKRILITGGAGFIGRL